MKNRIRMAMALAAAIIMTTPATTYAAYSWEEAPKALAVYKEAQMNKTYSWIEEAKAPKISPEAQIVAKTYSWIEALKAIALYSIIMPKY